MSKRKILKQQCKEIIQLNPTERVWQMPFFFALAVGFALSIAAYYDRMDLGLIAIIGIMALFIQPIHLCIIEWLLQCAALLVCVCLF